MAIVGAVKGGAVTIRFADAVALVLALVDATVSVVLAMPGASATTVLVTETLMLQLPVPPALNGTVALLIAIDVSSAAAPEVTVPPQVLVKFGTENTFNPTGNMSLQVTPDIACTVDELMMVNVKVVAVKAEMVEGLKFFATEGAAKRTPKDALAGAVLPPPSAVLRKPCPGDAAMVLM